MLDSASTLNLCYSSRSFINYFPGTFHDWSLLLYGTAEPAQPNDPQHPPNLPSSVPVESSFDRISQHIISQVHGRQSFFVIFFDQ